MKKLSKLNINPQKVMKNEELTTIRGGYGGHCCFCFNESGGIGMIAGNPEECADFCQSAEMYWWWDYADSACI